MAGSKRTLLVLLGLALSVIVTLIVAAFPRPGLAAFNDINDPQYMADAPWRIEPGRDVPLLLLVKDADQDNCTLDYVQIRVGGQLVDARMRNGHLLSANGHSVELGGTGSIPVANDWWSLTVWIDAACFSDGDNDVKIEFFGDSGSAAKRYLRVRKATRARPSLADWYLGDTHVHAWYTDNTAEFGYPVDVMEAAGRTIGLDWMALTDHSSDMDREALYGAAQNTLRSAYYLRGEAFGYGLVFAGLGDYPANGGWFQYHTVEAWDDHQLVQWGRIPWSAYNGSCGEARVASGDLDGDARPELVVGLGSGSGAGWLAIYDWDPDGVQFLEWVRVGWGAYNSSNGETWPACGDIDGDGRDELIAGLGSGGDGWFEIFDDTLQGYAHLDWKRLPWSAYNRANGESRPACGDVDGDGADELVVGLGSYPAAGGWLCVFDDRGNNHALLRWLRLRWAGYNSADGSSRPACGDLDGDGRDELVAGLGRNGGEGWLEVLDDASANYAHTNWVRVPWGAYNSAVGESRPACGDLDGDEKDEILVGLGSYPASGGWFVRFDDATAGFAPAWQRIRWNAYNSSNGEAWVAVGSMSGGASPAGSLTLLPGGELHADNMNHDTVHSVAFERSVWNRSDAAFRGGSGLIADGLDNDGRQPSISGLTEAVLNDGSIIYAAHPMDPQNVAIDGGRWEGTASALGDYSGFAEYYADAEGVERPKLAGLQLWNFRVTKKATDAWDPWNIGGSSTGTWQDYHGVDRHTNLLYQGLAKWNEFLVSALGRSPISRAKFFICGGSDAHGDLNYATLGEITTSYAMDNALGKIASAVYVPGLAPNQLPSRRQVIDALRRGQCVATDGPLAVFTLDNGQGTVADIGADLTLLEGAGATIEIRYATTPEFGSVSSMRVFLGTASGVGIAHEDTSITQDTGTLSIPVTGSLLPSAPGGWCFYRVAMETETAGGETHHCFTNPIWANVTRTTTEPHWRGTFTTTAPSPRYWHTAVWTGAELLVWGGDDGTGVVLNTGGRYEP